MLTNYLFANAILLNPPNAAYDDVFSPQLHLCICFLQHQVSKPLSKPIFRKKATKRKSAEATAMCGFEARAKDILCSVDELKAFVLANRDLYVGPVCTGDGDLRKGMDDR